MKVEWNVEEDECFVKESIENQTLYMGFQMTEWSTDTIHFNVYLTLYNKRNQITDNEAEVKSTGANQLKTFFCRAKSI